MMTYLARLWRGDIGLACTYWVWGVNVASLGMGLGVLLGGGFSGLSALVVVWFFLYPACLIFIAVAVWRSGSKNAGSRVWVWLARFIVVTAPFRVLVDLGSVGTLMGDMGL